MLKCFHLAFLLILILSVFALAEQRFFPDDLCRSWENHSFGVGEHFIFDIDYAFITAGQTEMKIDTVINFRGHNCYRLSSKVRSNKTFDVFFKVRDQVETYIDVKGIYSRRYFKKLQEGKYRDTKEVFIEQEQGSAFILDEGKYKKSVKIPPCSQDILSALFFVRTLDIKIGDTLNIPLHDVDKSYPLKISVNRREKIKVPAGEFDCLVVQPFLESEGMFRSKGKIEVWLTDDERKIPALMRTYIAIIGHIDAKLKKYTMGKPEEQD